MLLFGVNTYYLCDKSIIGIIYECVDFCKMRISFVNGKWVQKIRKIYGSDNVNLKNKNL